MHELSMTGSDEPCRCTSSSRAVRSTARHAVCQSYCALYYSTAHRMTVGLYALNIHTCHVHVKRAETLCKGTIMIITIQVSA